MTQGRGVFAMTYLRHDNVPNNIAQQIIANAKKEKGKAEEGE
jgi:translation elongation factor EF-G